MSVKDYRHCNFCKQDKPMSEFYDRQTRCKACMAIVNKQRGKQRTVTALLNSVFGSEGQVIQELRARGIPAYPGKSVSYANVDVVAWGSVGLEVKSSKDYGGYYQWGFTKQQNGRLQADLIVLVMNTPTVEFFVFPANHPVFFINGKRKTAVSYQPDTRSPKHHDRYVMSAHDMAEAKDRWSLIEEAKQAFSEQLMQGVPFPKWIRIGA